MDRREFVVGAGALALAEGLLPKGAYSEKSSGKECLTAAYYFGNYHVDPRNEKAHGAGWTEWNLVRAATPRFTGHHQPKVPAWGYLDESDPAVFEKKIAAAHDNHVDALIFDWYWYKDGPFLNRALQRGFLGASNNRNAKFALMWANHDWLDVHPAKLGAAPQLQFVGAISVDTFNEMSVELLNLFQHPSYLKIGGAPYFSIYEIFRFIDGMGGVRQAAAALGQLRSNARAIGLSGVHLNVITGGLHRLSGHDEVSSPSELMEQLGIDSTTSYVWVHHVTLGRNLTIEYADVRRGYEHYRDGVAAELKKVYFPNATIGWDATPRSCQTDNFRIASYPFAPVIVNNTPQAFENALRSAKQFAIQTLPKEQRIVTINSWNEWTEGSYLEPDTEHGSAYLNAVRRVFA
jgi:hypothetical protein